jgi:phosphate/sulfate permease
MFWGGGLGMAIAGFGFEPSRLKTSIVFLIIAWLLSSVSIYRNRFFEWRSSAIQWAGNLAVSLGIASILGIIWLALLPESTNPQESVMWLSIKAFIAWIYPYSVGFIIACFLSTIVQEIKLRKSKLKHNIVSGEPTEISAHIGPNSEIVSLENLNVTVDNAEFIKDVRASVVRIYNKPDNKRIVGDIDAVSLNLHFESSTDSIEIPRSAWLDDSKDHMSFSLNSAHYAVVLIVEKDNVFALDKVGGKTYRRKLKENRYHVTLRLIGERVQQTIIEFRFDVVIERKGYKTTARLVRCSFHSPDLCIQGWKKQ